jgi:hypothetical protein
MQRYQLHPRRAVVEFDEIGRRHVIPSRWRVALSCGHVIEDHRTWTGGEPRWVYCRQCPEEKR